jgi:2-polyprenyl-3-methyl-5-hydroxy-6-metoxy-1,4-benzoquinol methylase
MENKYTQSSTNSNYSGIEELINFEIGLKNYNAHTAKLIFNNLFMSRTKNQKPNIMDFGAGTGTIAEILRDKYQLIVDCIEVDSSLIDVLKGKKFKVFSDLENLHCKYKYIYTSNVIEHIEDDLVVLKKLFEALEINGKLLIYVPAMPFLFSSFDYRVGHFRRYQKKKLIKIVKEAGFSIEKCVYSDCIGFLAALMFKLKSKLLKNSDISQRNLIFYDKIVYPVSKTLDSLGLEYIIGKNLLLVAKK